MPKTGYFPHFFNTPENQTYVGELPGIKMYGADFMSENDNKNFLKFFKMV